MTDARFVEAGGLLSQKIGFDADASAGRNIAGGFPPVREELIEWEALLAAVLGARGRFVMVDAGAGFGRWLVSALCALRYFAPALPYRFLGVEADPAHFEWAGQHLRNNGADLSLCDLRHAAIAGRNGEDRLFVGSEPAKWYGQALKSVAPGAKYETTAVQTVTLDSLIGNLEAVDFLDLDVQGAEAAALSLPAAMDALTAKVRRACIATFLPGNDDVVLSAFALHGWTYVSGGRLEAVEQTAFGRIEFSHGLHHWFNPRLAI